MPYGLSNQKVRGPRTRGDRMTRGHDLSEDRRQRTKSPAWENSRSTGGSRAPAGDCGRSPRHETPPRSGGRRRSKGRPSSRFHEGSGRRCMCRQVPTLWRVDGDELGHILKERVMSTT
ncbi:uncharacterized protein SCHCODRAFT_02616473 [Schizophyllum commune H4-8]|uniref:uncharacterized protein n=1 Tax=Schizophyllum commune (strain H4-8 / FGSC 9210) TaxID=578458 RepID=UPI00215E83F0|nr:uncharacterized protein SCHCODRAFT_02616473 [Schizophyllum commune H4-8]KAI5897018.1 hypothetical protein SCHCODRAFT_02616473 [Schizophyllum commune H4-8]